MAVDIKKRKLKCDGNQNVKDLKEEKEKEDKIGNKLIFN